MYRKIGCFIAVVVCSMSLVACGSDQVETTASIEETETTEAVLATEQTEEDTVAESTENVISDVEIEAARQAAMDYYANTVFEVISITYKERTNCGFLVKVSKNGEVQEMERTITLKNKDGVWEVQSEGY